jgi:hypothetical protein
MRRQFNLPERDTLYLNTLGLPWETIGTQGVGHVLISDFPMPAGYTETTVTVALQIDVGYDDTQIDMAYFFPPIARSDGKVIGALATKVIDGKTFQRWSRHRTSANPWRPGEDYLGTHMALVEEWLTREFLLKP